MSRFILYSTLFLLLLIYVDGLSDGLRTQLISIHKACATESNLGEKTLRRALKGHFGNSKNSKIHFLCYAQKAGLMDENGQIQTENIRKMLESEHLNSTIIEDIIDKCVKHYPDAEQTALNGIKCFYQIAPKEVKLESLD